MNYKRPNFAVSAMLTKHSLNLLSIFTSIPLRPKFQEIVDLYQSVAVFEGVRDGHPLFRPPIGFPKGGGIILTPPALFGEQIAMSFTARGLRQTAGHLFLKFRGLSGYVREPR